MRGRHDEHDGEFDMITPSDTKLINDLERAEIAAFGDFYRAASARSTSQNGLQLESAPGTIATIASTADVLALNRVIGLGLERPATAGDIDNLIGLYKDAGVRRFFVQLSPGAEPQNLASVLSNRGFRHHNNWVKLYRDVSPPPVVATDLAVRQIGREDAAAFGRIVAGGFDWPEPAQGWVADLVGQPGWRHYMAFDGDAPVATGALFAHGASCWVDFAATLSDYRGRGAQSALMARRIRDAADLGCQQLVVETAEDTPTRSAPSFRNMLRFGFRAAYVRPNYVYATGA
jgi:GNAT superfamily N-acetyltransferase